MMDPLLQTLSLRLRILQLRVQTADVVRYEGQIPVRGANGRIIGNISAGMGAERAAHSLMTRYGNHVASGKDPEKFSHQGLHGSKAVDEHLQHLGKVADAHAAVYTSKQVDKLIGMHAKAEEELMRGKALGFATPALAAKAAREQDAFSSHLARIARQSPQFAQRINTYFASRRGAREQFQKNLDNAKLQQMAAKLREYQAAAQ